MKPPELERVHLSLNVLILRKQCDGAAGDGGRDGGEGGGADGGRDGGADGGGLGGGGNCGNGMLPKTRSQSMRRRLCGW
jgi:hypothetical protein